MAWLILIKVGSTIPSLIAACLKVQVVTITITGVISISIQKITLKWRGPLSCGIALDQAVASF